MPPKTNAKRHDLRIICGHLRTMDPKCPVAEAMAVFGDRILAVGSYEDVDALCPVGTRVERLDATITPGLIDTHLHMERGGLKILHDLGAGPHEVDAVKEHMRLHGFEEEWGSESPGPGDRALALSIIQPLMHSLGFTGVIDPAATEDEIAGYQACLDSNALTMRVVAMPYIDLGDARRTDVDRAIERLSGIGVSTGFGDDRLRIGGIKVYFDGEAMKEQALLRGTWPDGTHGVQRIPTEEFQRLVDYCATHGWSVGVHAVGDAAVEAVLDAFEAADAKSSIAGRGWQIIHGYLETDARSMARARVLGIILAAQPSIPLRNGARLAGVLGDWSARMNPLRSWLDAGVPVVLGSDGPYFPFDPRELMSSAITRHVRDRAEPLGLAEAITVQEALVGYTSAAAEAAFATGRRGVLAPGYLADWTAFDRDPVAVPTNELVNLRVLRTVVGGVTVHQHTRRSEVNV